MKKLLTLCLLTIFGLNTLVFASADRFIVEISSNPLMLNEAADLTIKAVDKNGDVSKSFVGDALLEIKGLDEGSYTLPNGGIVNFTASDQGIKKFFKGIIFKKTANATIMAEDILDENLVGKLDVEIKDPMNAWTLKKIIITSPVEGGTESNSNVNILWSSKELPNSPLQILIDGSLNASSSTNAQWEFSLYANNLSKGNHTLVIQINNADWSILAKSDELNFTVSDLADEMYKSIQIDPGTTAAEGEKITITVNTSPAVTTAELTLLGNSYFMEKIKSWVFEKKLKFNAANEDIQIDAKLTADGNTKSYPNIEHLKITSGTSTNIESVDADTSGIKITSIKSVFDPTTKKYMISRTVEGAPARYLVLLSSDKGTIKENPQLIQTTTEKNILVTPPSNTTYYLQVMGADENSNPVGIASTIVTLTAPGEYPANTDTCKVSAIFLTNAMIAGKNYLTWTKQSGVERYVVYQSSTPWSDLSQMTKIGETVDNKFEFAYDSTATEPVYRYYSIQGVCNDGKLTDVANSTKVQVGPWNIALYISMIIWFSYMSYLLIKKQEA